MKSLTLAGALGSTILAGLGQAHAAELLHVRCGGFTYFTGSGAPNPRDYVDIDIAPNNVWSVVYTLANGQVHSRNDQYALGDRSDAQSLAWGGTFLKNPKLYMQGAFRIDDKQKRVTYWETLVDRSLGGKVVMQQSALCGPSPNRPASVTAQAPAPAPVVTAQGGDVVGLVSNGNAAAVQVHFGAHDAMMLIDTGATTMSLTPDVANKLLQAGEAHYTGQTVQMTLANGATASEQEIVIDRVSIGSHSLANVRATITTADGMALLPFPVLNQMGKFTIDTRNGLLIFG